MTFKIIDLTNAADSRTSVPDGYKFRNQWIERSYNPASGHRYFKIEDDSLVEVARLDLDHTANRHDLKASTYPISQSGPELLEIQFIDVRLEYRLQGHGTWIVRELERTYPHLQLVALAEDSDRFWTSLGWYRIDPHDSVRRPLFVSNASHSGHIRELPASYS